MDTYTRIRELGEKQGWSLDTCLGVLAEYVDNQQSPEALEDFLAQQVDEENSIDA